MKNGKEMILRDDTQPGEKVAKGRPNDLVQNLWPTNGRLLGKLTISALNAVELIEGALGTFRIFPLSNGSTNKLDKKIKMKQVR